MLGLEYPPAPVDEASLGNEFDVRRERDRERRIGPDDLGKRGVGEYRPRYDYEFRRLFPYAVGNGREIGLRLGSMEKNERVAALWRAAYCTAAGRPMVQPIVFWASAGAESKLSLLHRFLRRRKIKLRLRYKLIRFP